MWKSIKEQIKIEVCDMRVYLALEAGLCALGMAVSYTHLTLPTIRLV